MYLADSEVRWYESALAPLIQYFSNRFECMQRIAICETADEISVICGSKIVITMNNINFSCIYCDDKIVNNSDRLCIIVHRLCKNLSKYNYKIRQIVLYSPHQRWSNGLISGEVVPSVDKVGEKVVMLTCR